MSWVGALQADGVKQALPAGGLGLARGIEVTTARGDSEPNRCSGRGDVPDQVRRGKPSFSALERLKTATSSLASRLTKAYRPVGATATSTAPYPALAKVPTGRVQGEAFGRLLREPEAPVGRRDRTGQGKARDPVADGHEGLVAAHGDPEGLAERSGETRRRVCQGMAIGSCSRASGRDNRGSLNSCRSLTSRGTDSQNRCAHNGSARHRLSARTRMLTVLIQKPA